MKCPMKFGNPCADVGEECVGMGCAWWVQKMRTAYNNEKRRTEAVAVESEGCAVAYAAMTGGGNWVLNDGSAE